ncbi:unnamed protein product [Schistosoma margrebowiei]|uniref:SEA domain-containing protein n=1 Tax=Schistosoma margrebowiei TaxID=48269 RepID=A0AA85AHJ2_9TREM|nr:unnamed protein product [Schistosoma margrebowiei]
MHSLSSPSSSSSSSCTCLCSCRTFTLYTFISHYSFSTGVHSDSTSIPPVTDITHPTQSDQTTSTSHLIDTTPTISTTAFQSTESTTLQTPVSTPVSTSQHTPESTSQPSPQSTLMQTGVHSDSTSIPPVTDITHPTQSDQTTSTSHLIDTTPTISTTAFQSTESTTLQTPVSTPVSTSQHTPESTSQPSPQSTLMQTGVHSDSTSIPPVTDITHPTQSDQTTSTSHLIDTTPTISTTAFQSTESTTLQTPVSTPVSTSQHTPESTSQPSPQSTLMQTAIFKVQGTLYTGNNSDLYLWSSDLTNSSTLEYITLKMKFCTFIIESLNESYSSIIKNAKCSNVIFIPINVNNLQIRQINNTNLIQGVQGIADIELLLINTTNINESLFITALIYHGMNINRTFNIYLLNIEVNLISNETTISTVMSTSKSTENKLDISSVTTSTPRFMSVVTSPEYHFISDGISFEAFENSLPPLFDKPAIGKIEAYIHKVESRDFMEWSDDLSIPTSAFYLNLSSQIQYLVTKSVQLANVQISLSFKILDVTFQNVIIQIETVYRVNNTEKYEYRLINSIFMKMSVEMRSLEASLLSDKELTQIFIEGWGKLNVTSGPNLVDIEFTQISVFEVHIVIYIEERSVPMNWSTDLSNESSVMYRNLSMSICDLLLSGLRLGNEEFSRGATCVRVVFIRIMIWIDGVGRAHTDAGVNRVSMEAVQAIVNVQLRLSRGSQPTETDLTETLVRGCTLLNIRSGPSLRNITAYQPTIGQIEAMIRIAGTWDLMEWSDDLSIPTSAFYLNLSSQIQYLVTKSVQLANVQISLSFKILNVTFEKYSIQLGHMENFRMIECILMKMTVEMRSLEASLLSDKELTQIFTEGWGKLNVTSGPNLIDIEFTRSPTSMSASTSSLEQTDRSISTEFAQLIRTTETVRSTSTVKTTSPSSTTTSDDFEISVFEVHIVIYIEERSVPMNWSTDLSNESSVMYRNLSMSICDLLLSGLRLGNEEFSRGATCVRVVFIRIMIWIDGVGRAHTDAGVNRVSMEAVQAIVNVQLRLSRGSQPTETDLTETLVRGCTLLNIRSGPSLRNITAYRPRTSTVTSTDGLGQTETSVSTESRQPIRTTSTETMTARSTVLMTSPSSTTTGAAFEISVFEVDIVIYIEERSVPMNWSTDLSNESSVMYRNLSMSICDLLLSGLRLGNEEFSRGATCVRVVFIRIMIWIDGVGRAHTDAGVNRVSMEAVQAIVIVQLRLSRGSQPTETDLTETLVRGCTLLNIRSGPSLRNITAYRKSSIVVAHFANDML